MLKWYKRWSVIQGGRCERLIIAQFKFTVSDSFSATYAQLLSIVLSFLVYQSPSGQEPQYLAADIQLISDSSRRQIHSTSDRQWYVPSATEVFASPDHVCGSDILGA